MSGNDEDFSDFVCSTLNSIGYSWEIIKFRRERIKRLEILTNNGFNSNIGISSIWAGSKREGSNTFLGGDNDVMHVFKEVIASENVQMSTNEDNMTVLKLDTDETSPGYARLSVIKHGGGLGRAISGPVIAGMTLNFIINGCCQVSDSGQIHLSSDVFIRTMSQMFKFGKGILQNCSHESLLCSYCKEQPRAGPSVPSISEFCGIQSSHDTVFAISCNCHRILERFLNRSRPHGWPTEDTIEELSKLEAHVVPVGFKRSAAHCEEWRICFTKAELQLIDCLTEPQFYVFVLLKLFAKDVLKGVWEGMTSYVMKNVILWVAELTPRHRFRTDTVVERFLGCLFFLKMCVKVGRLPSYMISERNLLSHDQFVVKKPQLLSVLDNFLQEKGSCLMRSDTLNEAMIRMYKSPDLAMEYGRYRDSFERTFISTLVRPMMSMQDVEHAITSGQASDLARLVLEMLTVDDIVDFFRDPAIAIRRILPRFFSHLR